MSMCTKNFHGRHDVIVAVNDNDDDTVAAPTMLGSHMYELTLALICPQRRRLPTHGCWQFCQHCSCCSLLLFLFLTVVCVLVGTVTAAAVLGVAK